jgi:hypothetical protein
MVIDCLVTLAGSFLDGFHIKDLDFASGVFYEPCALKGMSCQRNGRSSNAQHLGKVFLGELEIVAARQIPRPKKPPAQS